MADANVYIRYLADASKLVTESKKARRATDRVGEGAKATDKNFTAMAGRMATFFAGSAALAYMGDWIRQGTKMADTADLVRSSWDKTFGAAGAVMVSNLEEQRKALGLAEFEMQQLLMTTGQLAQQQGMTKDESAAFAQELFTMAGDVAAFTGNLDAAPDVLNAFQAALRGEFDPLEQFGIKLSQAAINQKALEMTGKAATKELTDQEKQAALLALITDALADETGALAEAMRDGATAENELTAEMADLQEQTGQVAQVAKRALMEALLGVVGALESMGGWIGRTIASWERWGNSVGGVVGAITRTVVDLVLFMTTADPSRFWRRLKDGVNSVLSPIRSVSSKLSSLISKASNIRSRIGGIIGRIPGFAGGGIVPGPTGAPQLALVHGGERVQTPAQQRMGGGGGSGGGATYNITVNAGLSDPYATAEAVVDLLRMYQRTQGNVPYADNQQGSAPA